jgi:hypothetical protein
MKIKVKKLFLPYNNNYHVGMGFDCHPYFGFACRLCQQRFNCHLIKDDELLILPSHIEWDCSVNSIRQSLFGEHNARLSKFICKIEKHETASYFYKVK